MLQGLVTLNKDALAMTQLLLLLLRSTRSSLDVSNRQLAHDVAEAIPWNCGGTFVLGFKRHRV